jgi:hypothetical protein
VSSSVAESFGHDRDFSAASNVWSSLLQEDIKREGERGRIGGTISASGLVRNCVRRQCLRSQTMCPIHE